MSRITLIDSIRGFSFIPMFIFHLFSTYDVTNNFSTMTTSIPIVSSLGQIRHVFIILAGMSLSLSALNKKNKKQYYSVRLKRSIQILIHAFILSALTEYLFPDVAIKFGILHFIGIATLLLAPIASNNILLLTVLLLCIFVKIQPINPTIDTIVGMRAHYNMADWFPLQKTLPTIISGVILGNIIFKNNNKISRIKTYQKDTVLQWMGKNSLNLYTGHVILLFLIFYIAKHYFHMY